MVSRPESKTPGASMTFSIVARCERTGQIGVAAITAVQSVGKLACHAIPKVGAIASQALLNPYLAYDGLRLLEQGISAKETLKRVLATDPHRQNRQVGIVDMQGRTAAWTGTDTLPWSGHHEGKSFSIQGNRLTGPKVLEYLVQSMTANAHLDLAERLSEALQAGEEAGGDKNGERSVNVLVFGEEEYPLCDIRIDDHDDPIRELRRLFTLYQQKILPNVLQLPKRSEILRPY